MGIDLSFYLGPYVEVKVVVADVTTDMCRSPQACPNQEKGFCTECGIKVCDRYKKQKDVEMVEEDESELFEDGEMFNTSCMGPNQVEVESGVRFRRYFWYPGGSRDGEPDRPQFDGTKTDEEHSFEANSKDEIKWFEGAYAAEIAKLKKVYGIASVKWGMLKWCS